MAGAGRRGSEGSARGVLAGAGLLAIGAALGVGVGSLVDAPRLLLRRLVEPAESVRLESPAEPDARLEAEAPEPELQQFRALQGHAPPEPPPAPPPTAPEAKSNPPPVAAARPPVTRAPSADDLIREIAARRAPGSPGAAGRRVVQVGAFADTGAAGETIARLRALGFDAYLSATQADGTYRHRVRVRPPAGRAAPALAADLERRGFRVWVTVE